MDYLKNSFQPRSIFIKPDAIINRPMGGGSFLPWQELWVPWRQHESFSWGEKKLFASNSQMKTPALQHLQCHLFSFGNLLSKDCKGFQKSLLSLEWLEKAMEEEDIAEWSKHFSFHSKKQRRYHISYFIKAASKCAFLKPRRFIQPWSLV